METVRTLADLSPSNVEAEAHPQPKKNSTGETEKMTREQEILNDLSGLVGQVTKINATLEASLAEGVDLQRLGRLMGEHEAVTAALWNYHHALDTRQHGGVAAGELAAAISDVPR